MDLVADGGTTSDEPSVAVRNRNTEEQKNRGIEKDNPNRSWETGLLPTRNEGERLLGAQNRAAEERFDRVMEFGMESHFDL